MVHPEQAERGDGLQDTGHAVRARPLPHPAVNEAGPPMEPLLLYPDPPPPELAQALALAGYPWKGVADERSAARSEPDDGWAGGGGVGRRGCAGDMPSGA